MEVHSDGAGGDHRLTSTARKVGAAVSVLDLSFNDSGRATVNDLGYKASGVEGPQTVPRPETQGGIMAAEVATRCGTDSTYMLNGDNNMIPNKLINGPNGDLWLKYKEVLNTKGIAKPIMHKVKAHADEAFLRGR